MLNDAAREPLAPGVKVTLTTQEPPPLRLDPQVFVCLKSDAFVPVNTKLVIPIADALAFVTDTVCAALVTPTAVEPNVRDTGENVNAVEPVPVMATDCGLPVALSVMVREAVRVPRP